MPNRDDVNIRATVLGKSTGCERVALQIVRAKPLNICDALGPYDVITPHVPVFRSIIKSLEDHSDIWTQRDETDDLHFARDTVTEHDQTNAQITGIARR